MQEEDRSTITFILLEAKDQAQMLSKWRVAKVKRECNLVANEIAHLARRTTHTAVWLGRAPVFTNVNKALFYPEKGKCKSTQPR